jgi:polysaccharide pyruvyl transferase WcaK-like protein
MSGRRQLGKALGACGGQSGRVECKGVLIRKGKDSVGGRIGLLTPYTGGNYGDGAIQEALIRNIRNRILQCELHGITLNPKETAARHEIRAHPLASGAMRRREAKVGDSRESGRVGKFNEAVGNTWVVVKALRRIYRASGSVCRAARALPEEVKHWVLAFDVLRRLDVLVIAGGGQIGDEWGGAWEHPYALFKWTVIARIVKTPVVFLSVGASRLHSPLSRVFVKSALGQAAYRSYRDERSRQLVQRMGGSCDDQVVPDLAFSPLMVPAAPCACPQLNKSNARVGISPITYRLPIPKSDEVVFRRQVSLLSQFAASVVRRGYTVVLFHSAESDRRVVDEVFAALATGLAPELMRNVLRPALRSVSELRAEIASFDCVVASRLHGVLLSHAAGKPVLAISYDPKVRTHMRCLGQARYCLDIHTLDVASLIGRFDRLQMDRAKIRRHLHSVLPQYHRALEAQYDHVFGSPLYGG